MSSFSPAKSIDEVIARLGAIVDQSIAEHNAAGMFAALYLVVTEKVREGILHGKTFQNGPRMERLDVVFANRYLEAWHANEAGTATTACWQLAFETARQFPSHIVLQELLTGMNAHVNLDLGIAAAEIAPGDQIEGLERDFNAINKILKELTDVVRASINDLSPRIALVDRWLRNADDAILDFSLRRARESSWKFALELAPHPPAEWKDPIDQRDRDSLKFGRSVASPGLIGWLVVWWIKRKESKDVGHIVATLRDTARHKASGMDFSMQ